MTKKQTTKPAKHEHEEAVRSLLMLQCGEDPWQTLRGHLLVATRNPAILRDLIAQGKFGELSRGLAALVPESGRPANHEFRLLHGTDGIWFLDRSAGHSEDRVASL